MVRKDRVRYSSDTDHNVAMWQIVEDLHNGTYDKRTLEDAAELITEMAKSDEKEARKHLKNLISHVLKWENQPNRRTRSWKDTVFASLSELEDTFEDSKSIENKTRSSFDKVYILAKRDAESDTGLKMPDKSPHTFDEYMDREFLESFINYKGLETNFYYRKEV